MSHGDGSLFISNIDTCEEGGASLAWLMRCLSMSHALQHAETCGVGSKEGSSAITLLPSRIWTLHRKEVLRRLYSLWYVAILHWVQNRLL